MSSLMPPPPEGVSWDDRRILGVMNTIGSTSNIFHMPIRRESTEGLHSYDDPTGTTLAVAHYLQTHPQSGTGEILALALADVRPRLTRVVALDVLSYGPLGDTIVRHHGRFPVRLWEEGTMTLLVEIMDLRFRRVAVIEGPAGMEALRLMRNPGEGVVCGDFYGVVVAGTLQLWFTGEDDKLEVDLKKASKKRFRWLKGFVGNDMFLDNPVMNEHMVAARKASGEVLVFWLDGTLRGGIPSTGGMGVDTKMRLAMTRFHLLVVRVGPWNSYASIECYALATLESVWVERVEVPDGGVFSPKKMFLSDDETCLMMSDGANMMCTDVVGGMVKWFKIPEDEEFDEGEGFWIVYSDGEERKRREVNCVWRFV